MAPPGVQHYFGGARERCSDLLVSFSFLNDLVVFCTVLEEVSCMTMRQRVPITRSPDQVIFISFLIAIIWAIRLIPTGGLDCAIACAPCTHTGSGGSGHGLLAALCSPAAAACPRSYTRRAREREETEARTHADREGGWRAARQQESLSTASRSPRRLPLLAPRGEERRWSAHTTSANGPR